MGNMRALICSILCFKKHFYKPAKTQELQRRCSTGVNNVYEVDFNYHEITERTLQCRGHINP